MAKVQVVRVVLAAAVVVSVKMETDVHASQAASAKKVVSRKKAVFAKKAHSEVTMVVLKEVSVSQEKVKKRNLVKAVSNLN